MRNKVFSDVLRDYRIKGGRDLHLGMHHDKSLGGEEDAAGWKGRCSWVEGEMQLGGEGDAAGWRGRKARGGRLDGPGRLRSKSYALCVRNYDYTSS